MSTPSTPQKQVQLTKLEQLPTPPLTTVARKEATHQYSESGPHVRRLTYDARVTQGINQEGLQQKRIRLEEVQDQETAATRHSEGELQQHNENEVKRWLSSSKTPEQRRQRFYSLLHTLLPSNDVFNKKPDPLYDEDEDGSYEFFMSRNWDRNGTGGDLCPYFDDFYDPTKDPLRSTELWQPKIGEEGIENEEDLRMVLKARQEQLARSEAFKKRKPYIEAALKRAGAKHGDRNMPQASSGPKVESSDSNSSCESDSDNSNNDDEKIQEGEGDVQFSKSTTQMGVLPAATDSLFIGKSTLKPTIAANGIRVFAGQAPSSSRGRPKGSRNKKGGKAKRKRGNNKPDSTYKYHDDSEDEQPLLKKAKKGKFDAGKAVSGDLEWHALTRSGSRRAQGMDGTYEEEDDENSTGADSSGSMVSSSAENDFIEKPKTTSLFARLASFISVAGKGTRDQSPVLNEPSA